MKAFYRIKRMPATGFWVKMYSDCKGDYYSASRQIDHNNVRKAAREAFEKFVTDLRRRNG